MRPPTVVTDLMLPRGDGATIAVSLHHPRTTASHVAVLCPGYLDSKDYRHLVQLAHALAARGWLTARFDPSGTWASGGDLRAHSLSRTIDDMRTVLAHLLTQGPATRVLVGGHSRGGEVSLQVAAREARVTDVLGLMPSWAPPARAQRRRWQSTGRRTSVRDDPGGGPSRRFSVPYAYCVDRDAYDTRATVAGLRDRRLMFFAGADDPVVPATEVRALADAVGAAARFEVLPGIDHDFRHDAVATARVVTACLAAIAPTRRGRQGARESRSGVDR